MFGQREPGRGSEIVGRHPALLEVLRLAERAAACHLPVLILGESGTGKELLARNLHVQSQRSAGPFEVVDCGVLCQEMARTELFGHAKGAFTGAGEPRQGLVDLARGGTLFLDEIGELDSVLQRHLLRLVQEGEYRPLGEGQMRRADVRIIAATHQDLESQARTGRFRQDLLYRLNVIQLRLPPLRERRSDIPSLLDHIGERQQSQGLPPPVFSREARDLLLRYDWPGNVRELANVLASLSLFSEGRMVQPEDLPSQIRCERARPERKGSHLPYKEARKRSLDRFIRDYLHEALVRSGGNVSVAARESGIGRQYFQLRMSEYGLRAQHYRRMPNHGR